MNKKKYEIRLLIESEPGSDMYFPQTAANILIEEDLVNKLTPMFKSNDIHINNIVLEILRSHISTEISEHLDHYLDKYNEDSYWIQFKEKKNEKER